MKRLSTILYYALVAIVASEVVLVSSYLILRQQSSLGFVILHSSTSYLFLFFLFTSMSAVLFSINSMMLVYQAKRYGFPQMKYISGVSGGTLLSILASFCPVCGATLLASLGFAGGLSLLPFQGIEIKAIGLFVLFMMSIWTWKQIHQYKCIKTLCPAPTSASYSRDDRHWVAMMIGCFFLMGVLGWNSAKKDPFFSSDPALQSMLYQCPSALKTM